MLLLVAFVIISIIFIIYSIIGDVDDLKQEKNREKIMENAEEKIDRAKVVSKRQIDKGGSSSAENLITFELDKDGSSIELLTPDDLYGLIFEGDRGTVSYKGRIYCKFQRDVRR